MEGPIISSVISKCTKSSISGTLKRWGRLETSDINQLLQQKSLTKADIAEKITRLSEEYNLHTDIIGDLELTFIQLHPHTKTWDVFRLDGNADDNLVLDPRSQRSRLIKAAEKRWKEGPVNGNMSTYAGARWFRLHLGTTPQHQKKKSLAYKPNNSVFLVTFPNSPYVIISRTRVQLAKIVSEAVAQVFRVQGLKDIKLSGRHVMSLADIVHKKNNEALSTVYRDKEIQEDPSSVGRKRKQTDLETEAEDVEGIVDESRNSKRLRRENVAKAFGSSCHPVLEKVEYKFNVQFGAAPHLDLKCESTVEIKGRSVLKGLYELSNLGFVKFPLPPHLTYITSNARNSFTIQDKKQTATDNI